MPEDDYTYSQQIGLEFVKSQYGAVVLGVFGLSIFGVTLGAYITSLIAPLMEELIPNISPDAQKAVKALKPISQVFLLANPFTAPFYLGLTLGGEVKQQVLDLNLGNRLWKLIT